MVFLNQAEALGAWIDIEKPFWLEWENRLLESRFEVVWMGMEFVKIKPTYSVHLNPRFGDALDWNGIGMRSRRARGPSAAGPNCCLDCNGLKLCPVMEA